MSMLYAIAGVVSVWVMHWILQPIPSKIKPTTKPPQTAAANMTNRQLFLQQLLMKREMIRRNVSRRFCKIGWEYDNKWCYRLVPYTFRWVEAKSICMSLKAQLTMVFSRKKGSDFVLKSMKRFNMTNTYASVGYYSTVDKPLLEIDLGNSDEFTEIYVYDLGNKDVTDKVKVRKNLRFTPPSPTDRQYAMIYRGQLVWMRGSTFSYPYCEYKRKPKEEPERWQGYPDLDMPPKRNKWKIQKN